MKKLLLSGLALGACLLMVGCGASNEDAVITNLSNQIDRLNNVIANSSVVSTTDFDLSNYTDGENDTSAIRNIYQKTSKAINDQESYKSAIKEKTAMIKNALSSKIKLGENTEAIRELANSLSKYTTKLTNTNNEYKKTTNSLSKMRNAKTTNNSSLGAKLTRLSSCCDSRICYYNNILNTLNQIQSILNGGGAVVDENGVLNNDYLKNYLNNNFGNCLYDANGNCINGAYCQDGKCYDCNGNCINGYCFDQNGNCVNGNCTPNQGYYQNGTTLNNQGTPLSNTANRQTNIPINKQYRPFPYNAPNQNGYNQYAYRNNTFNPNRNTDTYGPGYSNIDTYRNNGAGYGYYGYNNFEVKKDDVADDITIATKEDNNIEGKKDLTENKVKENKEFQTQKDNSEKEKFGNLVLKNDDLEKRDPNALPKKLPDENNTSQTQSSALINPDYHKTNEKIKELIQSSAPVTEDLSQNMLAL